MDIAKAFQTGVHNDGAGCNNGTFPPGGNLNSGVDFAAQVGGLAVPIGGYLVMLIVAREGTSVEIDSVELTW